MECVDDGVGDSLAVTSWHPLHDPITGLAFLQGEENVTLTCEVDQISLPMPQLTAIIGLLRSMIDGKTLSGIDILRSPLRLR